MFKKNVLDQVIEKNQNRRGLLRTLGVASTALAAGTALTGKKARAATVLPSDVVQFALNLEYLEAEFYSVASSGATLEERGFDLSGIGTGGPTTTKYGKVGLSKTPLNTSAVAASIAMDEIAHVTILRAALLETGFTPIAKPAINLDALAPKGASLANEVSFLSLARIFEDIGVSAYSGGAGYLVGSPYLATAARILAVEGEHVGNIRLQIATLGIPSSAIDGADVIPPPTGTDYFSTHVTAGTFNPAVTNGLCATRTPGEVLFLAYGGVAGVTKGGFFPNGVNGALNASSAGATAANLD
jgi:hypothetical protein